jgi:mRNA interferase MazF
MLRGEIWWADMAPPSGSGPGDRRPVVIISSDDFNSGMIRTVVVAILTANLRSADHPGNFVVKRRSSGLPRDSIVNVSQLVTLDRRELTDHVGQLTGAETRQLNDGLRLVLDL